VAADDDTRDPRALAREAARLAKEPGGARLDRKTLFYMVSRESFRDGAVDRTENVLLNRLRSFLRLDKKVAREIGKLARHEFKRGKIEPGGSLAPRELYRKVCERALADAVLDAHEREMLAGLADLLDLEEAEADEILARAEGWSRQRRGGEGKEAEDAAEEDDDEVAGKSAEVIALERKKSLEVDQEGLLEQWKLLSAEGRAPEPRPRTALEKIGGGAGIFCLTLTWASMVVLTLLFVAPVQELRGVVERREVLVDPGPMGESRSVVFWVRGKRFVSAVPGLVRWLRPGDQLLVRSRRLVGERVYLQEVRQLRESPRGYRYEDFGLWIAMGLSSTFVLLGLLGFGFAVRRPRGP